MSQFILLQDSDEFAEIQNYMRAVLAQKQIIPAIPLANDIDTVASVCNSFRNMQIMPQPFELFQTYVPHISKMDPTYTNIEQYLHLMYNLLREDCLRPLRECIVNYKNKKDINFIKLYTKVQIDKPTNQGQTLSLSIDEWFMYTPMIGALVCLSADDFKSNQFFCAMVVSSRESTIKIRLCDETSMTCINTEKKFTMLESPTYFEAYRHCLAVLQDTNAENFAFERYIVHKNIDIKPFVNG